jgi:hypothetical protein
MSTFYLFERQQNYRRTESYHRDEPNTHRMMKVRENHKNTNETQREIRGNDLLHRV